MTHMVPEKYYKILNDRNAHHTYTFKCLKLLKINYIKYLTGTMRFLTLIILKIWQWNKKLKGWLVSSSYKENKGTVNILK